MIARDPDKEDSVIDTNEYLIVSNGEGFIMDPGGTEIFPQVISAVSSILPIENIKHIFATHQDPDVISSLPLWMGLCSDTTIYMSWLWTGFISHFGNEYVNNFKGLPDSGGSISFKNGNKIEVVPAHYVHSSGNYSLFDPIAKILFSGDVGAALLPKEYPLYIEDISEHTQYMELFHKRWLPSNKAKNDWVKRVRKLQPEMICPQHGAVFKGPAVNQFLDWLEKLEVGITESD